MRRFSFLFRAKSPVIIYDTISCVKSTRRGWHILRSRHDRIFRLIVGLCVANLAQAPALHRRLKLRPAVDAGARRAAWRFMVCQVRLILPVLHAAAAKLRAILLPVRGDRLIATGGAASFRARMGVGQILTASRAGESPRSHAFGATRSPTWRKYRIGSSQNPPESFTRRRRRGAGRFSRG